MTRSTTHAPAVAADINANETSTKSWNAVKERMRKLCGDATFKSWLAPLQLVEANKNSVTLAAPTRFIREWVNNHYRDDLVRCWCAEGYELYQLDIITKKASATDIATQAANHNQRIASGVDVSGQNVSVLANENVQAQGFGSPLDRRFTFKNFVVGDANKFAHAAALQLAKQLCLPTKNGSTPLYLHGGVGLGKTHLMHAIAWHVNEHAPDKKVVYLSAEKFMYQYIKAIREQNLMAFKESFRSVDVLLIDDIQFICGKESTQNEFFHTFNSLMDQGKQLVLSADRQPGDLPTMDEGIRSRLGWGLVATLSTTDYELRHGIVKSKLNQMKNIAIPEDVTAFLAAKITSNIRELEGSLNKLVAHSTLVNRSVDLKNAKEILADVLRVYDRVITIDEIQRKVIGHFGIKMADMAATSRQRNIARPRQIAMFLAKQLTSRSLSEIGRKFGGRDHTTVMHAIKRIEQLEQSDKEIAADIAAVRALLG